MQGNNQFDSDINLALSKKDNTFETDRASFLRLLNPYSQFKVELSDGTIFAGEDLPNMKPAGKVIVINYSPSINSKLSDKDSQYEILNELALKYGAYIVTSWVSTESFTKSPLRHIVISFGKYSQIQINEIIKIKFGKDLMAIEQLPETIVPQIETF